LEHLSDPHQPGKQQKRPHPNTQGYDKRVPRYETPPGITTDEVTKYE